MSGRDSLCFVFLHVCAYCISGGLNYLRRADWTGDESGSKFAARVTLSLTENNLPLRPRPGAACAFLLYSLSFHLPPVKKNLGGSTTDACRPA